MPGPTLGQQLSGTFAAGGVNTRLYERGLVLDAPGGEVQVHFTGSLGRPVIVTGAGQIEVPNVVSFTTTSAPTDAAVPLVRAALDGRLSAVPVGADNTSAIGLTVGDITVAQGTDTHSVPLTASGLVHRQLYDVVVQLDNGQVQRAASHAVYFRDDWTNFGLAHITDMHVGRRIDSFRHLLRQAGRSQAADKLVNWNDRFRGFVRFANQLHREGKLDLVVATGDLYDYIYEADDDPNGGGNPEFLSQLILGTAPGPEFPDVEELLVPICVVPGNHDYRRNPYRLYFTIEFAGKELKRFNNFQGYGILQDDAIAIDQILNPGGLLASGDIPLLTGNDAGSMVELDRENPAYDRFIGHKGSYVLHLGKHRVVMLDTGPDTGIIDDITGAVRTHFGTLDEDEATFVGGSPNCEGLDDIEFAAAVEALEGAKPDALVILGMHAPLINTPSNEYPYFMRETQRPAQDDQPAAWVARINPEPVGISNWFGAERGLSSPEAAITKFPTWFPASANGPEVHYMKRGSSLEGLDFGVARGRADDLLQRIADPDRPADLVLGGHTHRHNEFVVRVEDGELRYYLDFYLGNPGTYYPVRYWAGPSDDRDKAYPVAYVNVVEGAHEAATPWTAPTGSKWGKVIQIPPYANPLDAAADKKQWWADHRPLIIQTSSLGPIDNASSSTSFSGFRLFTVVDDVIDRVDFISSKRLEAKSWAMPYEDAVGFDYPDTVPFFGRTQQFRLARSQSSPAACVVPDNGTSDIYYRDTDGNLMQLWRDNQGRWGFDDLTKLAGVAPAADGDPQAHLDTFTRTIHLPYRGTDGSIHCLYWSAISDVKVDNLTGAAGAPAAAGDPFGWYHQDTHTHHVSYRSADGHLNTLYWTGAIAAAYEDLTAGAGIPAAAGDPFAYVGGASSNVVTYRGQDGHIHAAYWAGAAAAGHDDLSAAAGTPEAAGDPVATYVGVRDLNHVIYRGVDGNIHAIHWVGAGAAGGRNLTADAGAPLVDSDPTSFYNHSTETMHVIYRTADGHVIDLYWQPGPAALAYTDLTATHGAPAATLRPAAWLFGANSTEHVAFRSYDGHIFEFVTGYAGTIGPTDPGGPGGGGPTIGAPINR